MVLYMTKSCHILSLGARVNEVSSSAVMCETPSVEGRVLTN